MRSLLLIAPLVLTACATVPADSPAVPTPGGMCHAEGLEHFVGQPANVDVAAQILRESGARTFRWTGPGIMVTMDLRADRVNANLNEGLNTVVGVSCG